MKIVILGGGTAGWIAAASFLKSTTFRDVTVVESSKLPIIGAGEGSTGSLPWFINNGKWPNNCVTERDFLRKTKGTPKLAINLKNWRGDNTNYYSTISASKTRANEIDTGFLGAILRYGRGDKSAIGVPLLENKMSPYLNKNGKIITDLIPYAYHFDGYEAGKYFKDVCLKFGMSVVDSELDTTQFDENGYLKSITLTNGQIIEGDLFIDCTGFNRALIGKTHSRWVSYKDNLPVNAAIPFATDINSRTVIFETLAETMDAGWHWKIPLQHRHGSGYVYCDAFQTYEQSLAEMEKHLGHTIDTHRNIKFECGRYDTIWNKNIVAVGLSSHFLEPLQATSIHISILTMHNLVLHFLKTKEAIKSDVNRNRFNDMVNRTIDDYRDLLQLHYLMGRNDTPFWKFAHNELKITDRNKDIIEISKYRTLNRFDFDAMHGTAGWGVWSHMANNAGLFHKEIIERELQNMGMLSEADIEGKDAYNIYNRMKNDLISMAELFKYLKA